VQSGFKVVAVWGFLIVAPIAAWAQRGDECWDKISSIHSDMIKQGFSLDGNKLEQSGCVSFNAKFRTVVERCNFDVYRQSGQEMLRQNEARFRQCQLVRQDWCTPQLAADHKLFEARQRAAMTISQWRAQCRNVD
jgi:hypothetical protein